MLIARPRGFNALSFDITDGLARPVASLALSSDRDGASLTHDNQTYRIARENPGGGSWQLRLDKQVVFEASKTPMIENRLLTTVKGAVLELAPVGRSLRAFNVVGPDWAQLGGITRKGLRGNTLHAELDDLVPETAQLFLLFGVLAIARGYPLG